MHPYVMDILHLLVWFSAIFFVQHGKNEQEGRVEDINDETYIACGLPPPSDV